MKLIAFESGDDRPVFINPETVALVTPYDREPRKTMVIAGGQKWVLGEELADVVSKLLGQPTAEEGD